jgi:protein O-mannosyl-transferase
MNDEGNEVNFKGLFLPLTIKKAIVFIFLIGFAVFFNSLFNGFVGDDDAQIVKNLNIHSISNIPSFFVGSTFYNGSEKMIGVYYKPLLASVFAAIYSFLGSSPFSFHFVQILLHISNSCLLFLFLDHFFKKSHAFLLSLFFLLHPFNSETVLYVSAMQDVLFFFFGILIMHVLTRFKSKKYLFPVFVLLLFSLFSKETGMLFLFVSLVYIFMFNRKNIFPALGISAIVLITYFFLRINSIGLLTLPTNSPIDKLSLPLRLLNAPEIILFYLRNFFLPIDFALTYQWAYTSISFNHFFLPLAVDLIFTFMIVWGGFIIFKKSSGKYFKIYLFFTIWLVLGLMFHLQIFPLDQTVADRWFYFPIVGLLGIIAVLLEAFNVSIKNKWNLVFIMTILILLSARTVVRSYNFRDKLTLYRHDVAVSKDSFALENVLGLELVKLGKLEEAKRHIERSIALYPYFSNYDNLGEIYVGLGDYKKARQAYEKAMEFGDYYIVYEDMAGLSLVDGDPVDNMKFIAYALRKFPHDAKLWLYLAIVSYQNKDVDIAKHAITQSYLNDKSNPGIPYFYNAIMSNQPLNLKINLLPQ